jgi:uncharacterized protein YdeI (YjbR/CyaY-like superfamily)
VAVERPHLDVGSRAELRAWLEEHHAASDGVWFVRHRKGSDRYVAYEDLAQEVLCFGWIDSQARPLDDERSLIQLTPRRPRSRWSKVNKARIERLEADGLITPAGAAVIEAAKASGAWTELDAVEALTEPEDLAAALDARPEARAEWDAFPPSAKKVVLTWVQDAKRPETRTKRITRTVDDAAQGIRANQPNQPKRRRP